MLFVIIIWAAYCSNIKWNFDWTSNRFCGPRTVLRFSSGPSSLYADVSFRFKQAIGNTFHLIWLLSGFHKIKRNPCSGLVQAYRVVVGWGYQISRPSTHEGGKVSHALRPPLSPRKYSWYSPAPVQTHHVFPGGKAARACRSPTPSSAVVKERVELYIYSPSGPSWPVLGWALTLLLLVCVGGWVDCRAIPKRSFPWMWRLFLSTVRGA